MSADKIMPVFGIEDVEVEAVRRVYDGFFKIDHYCIRHRLFGGGQSGSVERELFERGDAVAVLPYDPVTDEVILVEQFRIGALAAARRDARYDGAQDKTPQSPWLIECIAGMVDKGRQAAEVVVCEAEEEAGLELTHVTRLMQYFSSSGGTSERVTLYAAIVDSRGAGGIHGLECEHEDIRVLRIKYDQAIQWVKEGKLNNATTLIAMQWLQLNKTPWLKDLKLTTVE